MNKVVVTLLVVSVAANIYQLGLFYVEIDNSSSTARGKGIVFDDLSAQSNLYGMATEGFRVNWVNCSYKDGAEETTQLCDVSATTEPWFSAADGGTVDGYLGKSFYGASGLKPRTAVNMHLECNRANVGTAGACRVLSSKFEDAPQSSFKPQN